MLKPDPGKQYRFCIVPLVDEKNVGPEQVAAA